VKREGLDFLADNPHFTKRFAFYVAPATPSGVGEVAITREQQRVKLASVNTSRYKGCAPLLGS
jgi:hypothetical protein